jgi:hypothetical protein
MNNDPIFPAIDAHRIAANEWFEVSKSADVLANEPQPDRFKGVTNVAATMEHAARIRLFETVPTTLQGCIALLRYIQEVEATGGCPLELIAIAGHRISGLALVARLIEGLMAITGQHETKLAETYFSTPPHVANRDR